MPSKITAKSLQQFHKNLQDWYDTHGRRTLPWRNTNDPYAIYVSEIMLQQTQVKTVLERYYQPFLKQFPTLKSLAKADEQDVLKAWEGLGYYSRARNLHKAAKLSAPHLPDTLEALEQLPGIGKNTAHAIAAFAYHQPVPVMEANLKRVLSRLFAIKTPKDDQLWEHAYRIVNKNNPFDYNQSMMDIGAMICSKRDPQCEMCPCANLCEGKSNPTNYPTPIKKKATPIRKRNIVVFTNEDGRYFMEVRTSRFLGGLYGFTEYESDNIYFMNTHYLPANMEYLGAISQTYSHFQLQANVYLQIVTNTETSDWYTFDAIKKLPSSKADQKVIRLLEGLQE
jgi:A/G-specific adenine glycosylase